MINVFDEIKKLLDSKSISYEVKEHDPVYTSEQAAKARGEDIKIGAKAMVLKVDKKFVMIVLSAALKIDGKKIRKELKVKKVRFATPEEVKEKTGCVLGSVPPFGNLFDLEVYVDKSLLDNEFMAFNAGLLTKSIKMKRVDYLSVVKHSLINISK